MNAERHGKNGDLRRLAVLLGVYALLLRCVIAPGLMPDPAAAALGVFKLIICTGRGIEQRPAPQNGPADTSHHGAATLCSYAASGHLATAPEAPIVKGAALRPVYASAAAPGIARLPSMHGPSARAPPLAA